MKPAARALEDLPTTHVYPQMVLADDRGAASLKHAAGRVRYRFADFKFGFTELEAEPSPILGRPSPRRQPREPPEEALQHQHLILDLISRRLTDGRSLAAARADYHDREG